MKTRIIAACMTLMGLSLLGSARAEDLNSKLADMTAAVVEESKATSQEQQAVTAAPVDEAQQQAEARDAANKALENARGEQK